MNDYEITYLANPKLDESEKNKLDEEVDAAIAERQGTISFSSATDAPGSRRRLHYPIVDQRVTWLRTMQVTLDPQYLEDVRQTLRKQDSLTRLSIIHTPRREGPPPELLDLFTKKKEPAPATTETLTTKKREVSMKEVEEKIEEALDEEVK